MEVLLGATVFLDYFNSIFIINCQFHYKRKIRNFLEMLTFLVVLLSAWIVINGAIFDQRNLNICGSNNYQLEFLCWYVPEFSVLIRPFIVWSPLTFNNFVFALYIAHRFLLPSHSRCKVDVIKGTFVN